MTNQIMINENNRVIAKDSYNNDFQDIIGDAIGLVWMNSRDGFKEYAPYWRKPVDYYAVNFLSRDYASYSWQDKRLNAYAKYLTVSGLESGVIARRITLQGYSQSEWADAIVYAKSNDLILDSAIESIRAWWRGDVYDLQAQYKKEYTAADGETIERWLDYDDARCGGYLLEYGELTENIAHEFFNDFVGELEGLTHV
jgi:hypothetical protein